MRLKIILALLLWGGMASTTFSDDASNSNSIQIENNLDAYLNAWHANNKFNGNVLIAKGDEVLYSKSFGWANREFGIKNAAETKFLIGSITKPFTAYGILLLENQGKLALSDQLSKYFPDFPNAENVTLKQLLTHRSGIRNYHDFPDWKLDSKTDLTPQDVIKKVKTDPYSSNPGEGFRYSNTGYILLGLIIEQVSGLSFDAFVENEICQPLQLEDTGVMNNEKVVKNLAEGYTTTLKGTQKADFINYNQPFTSGNMYSTTEDLWKFTQAVMSSQLLPQEKTKEIFTAAEFYGYGWGIRDFDGVKAYGHHGGMNGFVGSMTYVPDEEYFICFLTNDDNTPKYNIAEDIIHLIQGEEVERPEKMEPIELTEIMQNEIIGDYLVKAGDTLRIYHENDQLFLQETGQIAYELFPYDDHKYAFSFFEFNAEFADIKKGKAQTLKFVGKSNVVAKRLN